MFGYFESKGAAERVVAESGLPWTKLRSTQFYDLILVVARQLAKFPAIPVATGFALPARRRRRRRLPARRACARPTSRPRP
jgi:uncharacterized protein YbjT (DUF2867 family)